MLISMPFGPLLSPSLGLSLLKEMLPGVRAEIRYLTLSLAQVIGPQLYLEISTHRAARHSLVGEWIFSRALFKGEAGQDDKDDKDEDYVERVLRCQIPGAPGYSQETIRGILRARDMAGSFVDSCVEQVLLRSPRIVGFTNLHHQQVASLALARRLKEAAPGTFMVLGGSGCDGPSGPELIRQFQFVDAVVVGEGELAFPELVQRVLVGQSCSGLQGVRSRDSRTVGADPADAAPGVAHLDDLPVPDLSDYFEQLEQARLGDSYQPELCFEMSRGCWWGEQHHCRFCGINGPDIAFRRKSSGRVLKELTTLLERYPGRRIFVVDSNLSMDFFDDLIPSLAAEPPDGELFLQVRSTLSKGQLQLLRDAGVGEIQSGVESLSTEVLRLMHKGVTALQNIQLLKWCKEADIPLSWLMIWGIPGEPVEEYQRLAKLIPWLTHLPPPAWGQPLRLDRFSPYFDHCDELGIDIGECLPAYRYVYPLDEDVVANLARSFTFEYHDGRDVAEYAEPVARAVQVWREVNGHSDLRYIDSNGTLLIWDFRPSAVRPITSLSGVQRAIFLACSEICSLAKLERVAEETTGKATDPATVPELLQPLIDQGLVLKQGGSVLNLALPAVAAGQG